MSEAFSLGSNAAMRFNTVDVISTADKSFAWIAPNSSVAGVKQRSILSMEQLSH
jgi:hypothetical protein